MGHERDPSSRRRTPIRLASSDLTGDLRVYALFDYTMDGDALVAKTGGKEDVTQDFLAVAAEQWPHLVEEDYIEMMKGTEVECLRCGETYTAYSDGEEKVCANCGEDPYKEPLDA